MPDPIPVMLVGRLAVDRRPNRSDRRPFVGEPSVQRQNWNPTPAEAPVAPLALVRPTFTWIVSTGTVSSNRNPCSAANPAMGGRGRTAE